MGLLNHMLKPADHGSWGAQNGELVVTMHESGDGTMGVNTFQRFEPILEENAELRNSDSYTGDFQEKWGRRVGQIPKLVLLKWIHEGFDYMKPGAAKEVLRRLDTKEYEHLKTTTEKVSRVGAGRAFCKASFGPPKIVPAKVLPNAD